MSTNTSFDMDNLPLRLTSIQIEGNRYANPKIPIAYLQTFNDCRSKGQLSAASQVATAHMLASGLYTDVSLAFLPDTETNEFSNNMRLFCRVTEPRRWGLSTGIQTTDQMVPGGNLQLKFRHPINGFGERIEVAVANNHRGTAQEIAVDLVDLQNTINSKIKYNVGFHRTELNREWVSGFNQVSDSFTMGGSTYDHISSLQYELSLRKANPAVQNPESEIIKSSYEPNLKSALRLTRTEDRRDNVVEPRFGTFYRLMTEGSGLIGDSNALKLEGAYQYHKPLSPRATFSFTLRGGVQQPFKTLYNLILNKNHANTDQFDVEKEYQDTPIFDRFFASSNSTRGLTAPDMGPKAGRHAFGSDAYVTSTAAVTFAVPNFEDIPIRPHVFFNASQYASLSTIIRQKYGGASRGLKDTSHLSASFGTGIVFPLSLGRIECNVSSQIQNNKIMKPTFSVSFSSPGDW